MSLTDLLAIVLATGAVIDCWRNGDILSEWRSWSEAKADTGSLLGRLLVCDYCLSFHVPLWLALSQLAVGPWVIYPLAATRASLLLDWLLPATLSYSRIHHDEPDDGPDSTPSNPRGGPGES